MIIAEAGVAAFPSFTIDHQGNPVIWWSATDTTTDKAMVHFAVSKDGGKSFGEEVVVPATQGFANHAEGMARLAVKPDGTILCVYQVSRPTEMNRFASYVAYVQSFDGGRSWTEPKNIHSDKNENASHAFVDMAITPDGEAYAVWIDSRNRQKNSQIFASRTNGKDGFGEDFLIIDPVCQCCKLRLDVDAEGKMHQTYRGVTDENVRDMTHAVSEDGGKTWSEPRRVAADNWVIDGRPHNGGSLTSNSRGYHFAWFTAGDDPGLSYTRFSQDDGEYLPKDNLSEGSYNVSLTTLEDDRVVIAWDEYIDNSQKIGLAIKSAEGLTEYLTYVGVQGRAATFPAVLPLGNNEILLAWGETGQGHSVVAAKRIEIGSLTDQTLDIQRLTKL